MRNKFIRNFRKELLSLNRYSIYDIDEIIHIANITFKKCKKEFKDYKRKIKESKFK